MKIDPVTYEVDMSAGTHPLYVWERRFECGTGP